jgi:hypothetical protein
MQVCKMIEKRLWDTQHPLRQFSFQLEDSVISKLETMSLTAERMLEMPASVRLPRPSQHLDRLSLFILQVVPCLLLLHRGSLPCRRSGPCCGSQRRAAG